MSRLFANKHYEIVARQRPAHAALTLRQVQAADAPSVRSAYSIRRFSESRTQRDDCRRQKVSHRSRCADASPQWSTIRAITPNAAPSSVSPRRRTPSGKRRSPFDRVSRYLLLDIDLRIIGKYLERLGESVGRSVG
jgi:hypothetical protein